MRRLAVVAALLVAACLLLVGCQTPEVSQGTVVRHDADSHLLVIADEREPDTELSIDTGSAQLGAEPGIGGVVRVSYHREGDRLVAERVMNVSRQEERRSTTH